MINTLITAEPNKKYVLKRITKKYHGYKTVSYIKQLNTSRVKKHKTIYDNRNVAFVVSLETGEVRHKTRLELQKNIIMSKSRTLKKMRDYVQANEWSYFLTLTFNNEYQDRLNDNEVIEQFHKYRNNLKTQYPNAYYVFVAEYHKKGGLHFHGVIGGISKQELGFKYAKSKKKKGGNGYQPIYNVTKFKYGFTTATNVDNSSACGHYIMKYVTKNMGDVEILKNRYMASKNLLLPDTSVINNFTDVDFNLKTAINWHFPIENNLFTTMIYARHDYIVYKIIDNEDKDKTA